MPHRLHLVGNVEDGLQATLAASAAETPGRMRQLSRLGTGDRPSTKITPDVGVAALEHRGLAEGDMQGSNNMEPGMPALELEEITSGESSITFAGARLPRRLSLSRANSFRLSRANSFKLSPADSLKMKRSTSLQNLRVGLLDPQPSQSLEVGNLGPSSSQERHASSVEQEVAKELFAAAQHAQRAEIAALTERLAQQEQQLNYTLASQLETQEFAAKQEKDQEEAVAKAQAQIAELQERREEQLLALASRSAGVAKLENEIGAAHLRVPELEAQARALELETAQAVDRCLRLEREAARVAELLEVAPDVPGVKEGGEAPSSGPSPNGAVIAAARGLVGRLSAMQEMYMTDLQQRQELHSQVEAAKAAPLVIGRNAVADRGGSQELKRLRAVADELRGQVAVLRTGTCTLTERLQSSRQQVQHLQAQLASSCSPRHLHRSDTLPAQFVRNVGGTLSHLATPGRGEPKPRTASSGGSGRGRLSSAPELNSVDLGGYSTWITSATTAISFGEYAAVPSSPTTTTATTQLPCIGSSLHGPSTPSIGKQPADAVPCSRSPCFNTEGQSSRTAPSSRVGAVAALLQDEQHGKAHAKPRMLARTLSAPAAKAPSKTQGAAGQLRPVESKKAAPSSPNPPCSPLSATLKTAVPSNLGQDNAGLNGGGIKAWRPEPAPGARVVKPASKGRWS